MKALLRRPGWVLLLAISAFFFSSMSTVPHFYLEPELPFTGIGRWPIFSLGEWGRAVLLMIGTYGSGLFVLFVAFLATGTFFPELIHREVVWATPRAGWVRLAGARVLAVSTVATFLICLGASAAFFNPINRELLVLAGAQYVPVYLLLVWIQILLWVTLSLLFLYLTRSRWVTLALVALLQVIWFLTGIFSLIPDPFLRLIQRSYLAWNFMGPFVPWGLVPTAYLLQGLTKVGVIVGLVGAAIVVRRSFPEWAGIELPCAKAALAAGVVLAVGAGAGTVWEIQRRTAPFPVEALWQWQGRIGFDRPYIWSRDGRLLFYPGEYMAVRLPEGAPLPAWVEELAVGKELHRYNVGEMIVWGSPDPQSLILIHPPQRPYPAELAKAVQRFLRENQPLLERAQLWMKRPKIIFAWPEEAFWRRDIDPIPEGFVVPMFLLSWWHPPTAAWALAVASGVEGPARTYLGLYVKAAINPERVEEDLDRLRATAEGRKPDVPWHWREPWPMLPPWWNRDWGKLEAARILHHWQQGEELGHENYIRKLLEERN